MRKLLIGALFSRVLQARFGSSRRRSTSTDLSCSVQDCFLQADSLISVRQHGALDSYHFPSLALRAPFSTRASRSVGRRALCDSLRRCLHLKSGISEVCGIRHIFTAASQLAQRSVGCARRNRLSAVYHLPRPHIRPSRVHQIQHEHCVLRTCNPLFAHLSLRALSIHARQTRLGASRRRPTFPARHRTPLGRGRAVHCAMPLRYGPPPSPLPCPKCPALQTYSTLR